ncbi:MAG: hypothetical protein WA418_10315 [Bradyrhizobium sp.]
MIADLGHHVPRERGVMPLLIGLTVLLDTSLFLMRLGCLRRESALPSAVVPDKPWRARARRGADPGPIRRGGCEMRNAIDARASHCSLGLSIPAFAGMTAVFVEAVS